MSYEHSDREPEAHGFEAEEDPSMPDSADAVVCTTPPGYRDIDDALATPGEQIAGVTVVHISEEPPFYPDYEERGFCESLRLGHQGAAQAFQAEQFEPRNPRGIWDNRVARLTVGSAGDDATPIHTFFLNDTLMERIKGATQAKGADLSCNELTEIGLSQTHDAVNPDFTNDAMNAVNASYYASGVAFSPEAGLADLFASHPFINRALGALFATESGSSSRVRVKELGSGARGAHWAYKIQGAFAAGVRQIDVTLTDFVEPTPVLDTSGLANITVTTEPYSLFDDMPDLPPEERYDFIETTYTFDSVWQPEDIRIVKRDGEWYQVLYRVKVADWSPRKDELLDCMRRGVPLPGPHTKAKDYDGIVVESAMQPFDISEHPYGRHIEELGREAVNIPGGLIKRVLNAFESQLTENGVFVSGDVGDFGFIEPLATNEAVSGVAARYRADDYVLAKKILEEEYGLVVQLLSLEDLTARYLPSGWERDATDRERYLVHTTPTNGIMIVKRPQKPRRSLLHHILHGQPE